MCGNFRHFLPNAQIFDNEEAVYEFCAPLFC